MKGKLYTTIGILCLTSVITGYSQKSSIQYDLSEYKLPKMKRHALDLDFKIEGNTYHPYSSYTNSDTSFSNNSNSSSFLSNIEPTYRFYLNSSKWQVDNYFHFSPISYAKSDHRSDQMELGGSKYTPSIGTYGENKWYFTGNKYFVGLGHMMSYSLNNSLDYIDEKEDGNLVSEQEMKEHELDYSARFLLKIGIGRIENVEDARLAIYILEDLSKAGVLDHQPTKEEVEVLAVKISQLRNERFFDSRIKKIQDMEEIDAVLQELGLIKEQDVSYFAIVNDNWDFANGPERKSGVRLSVGPRYMYNGHELTMDTEIKQTSIGSITSDHNFHGNTQSELMLDAEFVYEKPLNHYWQLSAEAILSGGIYQRGEMIDSVSNVWYEQARGNLLTRIMYMPNSRTSISFALQGHLNHRLDDSKRAYTNVRIVPSLIMDYYVSEKLRLNLSAFNMFLFDKLSMEDDEWFSDNFRRHNNLQFTAGLKYQIL
ncbi:MAG: hypothetical protein MI922_06945 [Bacteroidales bacterium]|nr:hypothetical protein [Bacteroidales bacterium]